VGGTYFLIHSLLCRGYMLDRKSAIRRKSGLNGFGTDNCVDLQVQG